MSTARFPVYGRLDRAGASIPGTVTIDRRLGIFGVRPKRRRRVYELPLSAVAEIVCTMILRREAAEKRAAAKANRKANRKRT